MEEQRFLVVDDEEIIRDTLNEILVMFGKKCDCVENGENAIQHVATNPDLYQAVFLDLYMPGLDGTETFEQLKKVAPNLPVYIVSGYGNEELAEEMTSMGISGMLFKPFKIDDLKKILSDLDENQE